MHFTDTDIELLGEAFKESLRKGNGEFPDGATSLAKMQDWMVKHHVEHPEVLQSFIAKTGSGSKAGKKNMP